MGLYNVNLQISAGTDFYQEFFLTEVDLSPLDVTDMLFSSSIKKHASAVLADTSSKNDTRELSVAFETGVVDGPAGVYYIRLKNSESYKLEEGKYVYSTVMTNPEGEITEVNSGLVFVDVAFGMITEEEDTEEPDPIDPGPDPIDPPGSGGGDGGEGTAPPGGTPYP